MKKGKERCGKEKGSKENNAPKRGADRREKRLKGIIGGADWREKEVVGERRRSERKIGDHRGEKNLKGQWREETL